VVVQAVEAEEAMKKESDVLGWGRQRDNVPGRGAEGTSAGSALAVPKDPRGGKSGGEGAGTRDI
jgi:hypothetical protein